jgi:hypothetical protein
MIDTSLARWLFFAGVGQLGVLIASALVPFRLNWRDELRGLSRLHRQMYWVYGGYIVLSITAFAVLSILNSRELASGSDLARGFCAYVAVFWSIRVVLQAVFDVKKHLTTWWLKSGYFALTIMFAIFTIIYSCAALHVSISAHSSHSRTAINCRDSLSCFAVNGFPLVPNMRAYRE